MEYPKLRDVEAFPVTSEGERYLCLRDPLKHADKVVFLPEPLVFLVSLFDGAHSMAEIQAAVAGRFGPLVLTERINSLVLQLDSNLFLQSDRYQRHLRQLEADFAHASCRKAAHSGTSYPSNSHDLAATLDRHCQQARLEAQGQAMGTGDFGPGSLRALIVPHIDLRVGGACYGWGYEALRPEPSDLYVILGTAHAPTETLFVGTSKDFESPLGTVKTNRPVLEELGRRCGDRLFEDEFVHQQEHSIEFQTLYLQYLFGGRREFTVLPILCGSFHQMLRERKKPEDFPEFCNLVESLVEVLDRSGLRSCLVAGADLAHIGLRFGDALAPEEADLQTLRQEDRSRLADLEALDRQAFWESIARDGDRRRICGFPCIYTMMSVLKAQAGFLLRYDQMNDRNTGSAVSFASMVFRSN